MLRTKLLFGLAVLALLAISTPASAQWTETKFMADTPVANDKLGSEAGVAIDGNVGIVGGWQANSQNGKAYLFDVTTGLETFPLVPASGTPTGNFGMSVAIDGNLALVGARGGDKAYLFDVSTGSPLGEISGANGFGAGSAISGTTVVISSQWNSQLHVYDVSDMVANPGTGSAVMLGTGPIGAPSGSGGFASTNNFALSGNTLIAGAPSTGPNWLGAAYAYDLSVLGAGTGTATEVRLDPLYTPTGNEQMFIGGTVDIEDGMAIVAASGAGASVDTDPLWMSGMAFLFDVSNVASPSVVAEIVPGDPGWRHGFGSDVGISGDAVIVGGNTRYADHGTWLLPGDAYLFDISDTNAISLIQKETSDVLLNVDGFSTPVAIDDGVALVAAAEDDEGASNAGAVYIYTAPPSALVWDGGAFNWDSSHWNTGNPVEKNMDMVIDVTDSVVTVAADFTTISTTGPAKSVFVGETNAAKLVVAGGVTLEVTNATTAGEMGKIAIDNLATLKTGTAVIELEGRLISGVQGNTISGVESGVLDVQTADGLTLEDGAEAIQVDWLPLPPNPGDPLSAAASMFGGVYTVAKYTGTALATAGKTTNSDPDSNIGAGYIKSVAYDVDLGASVLGVQVTLEAQGLGDTDLDADVDGDDLATFGLAWSPSGTDKTWFDGDFDFDGDIDGDDLAALGLAWAPGGISFPAGDIQVTTVPEPCTIIMLLIGLAGLLIYRKRR